MGTKKTELDQLKNENERLKKELLSKEQTSFNLNLLRSSINSISESIYIIDVDKNFLFVNDAFLKTYGYKESELISKSVDLIRSDKNAPSIYELIDKESKAGGWRGELFNKKKSGEEFKIFLSTSLINDDNKNPIAIICAAQDLTEQINAENILKEAEDKYNSLFTDLKDAIYESTPDGKLIDINPSGVELFGYKTKDDLLKVDIAKDLYVDADDRAEFKKKLEEKGFVKNYEIKIKKRQGIELFVIETAAVLKDRNGKIKSYRGILRDITESKVNERLMHKYVRELADVNKQLTQSESKLKDMNSEKDKFFSIIAHDLKSPFNALLNLSEFLIEDLNELTMEEIRTFSKEINKSAHNVFNLIENLLQWAQIKTGRLEQSIEKVPLSNVVSTAMILLEGNAAKKNIKLQNEVKSDVFFEGDKNMISSVIQNLISNAIKFTNRSGQISVSSKNENDMINVMVMDNGIGMSKQNQEKLFKIDQHITTLGTAKESGTGLGLILCKELIEKNGGIIWVKSEEKVGTTFFFTLPKAEI